MEWQKITDGVYRCHPYRIEKGRYKYRLYRYMTVGSVNTLSPLGKFVELEDAMKAAQEDSEQLTLWG